MNSKHKRIGTVSLYQKEIIKSVFLPPLIVVGAISVYAFFRYLQYMEQAARNSPAESFPLISNWNFSVIVLLWVSFFVLLIWAYIVSNNLVGAFERIIREVDEVIEGKHKNKITARNKDKLANDLLKRINILIERIP